MDVHEPCQVGNKAALRGIFHVPQGHLPRVDQEGNAQLLPLAQISHHRITGGA